MSLSFPHAVAPRIAPSWALQTATGLFIAMLQTTIQPSASPVTSRVLERMKEVEWTCAE